MGGFEVTDFLFIRVHYTVNKARLCNLRNLFRVVGPPPGINRTVDGAQRGRRERLSGESKTILPQGHWSSQLPKWVPKTVVAVASDRGPKSLTSFGSVPHWHDILAHIRHGHRLHALQSPSSSCPSETMRTS